MSRICRGKDLVVFGALLLIVALIGMVKLDSGKLSLSPTPAFKQRLTAIKHQLSENSAAAAANQASWSDILLRGAWNTTRNQTNIIECVNLSKNQTLFLFKLYNPEGRELASLPLSIAPLGALEIPLELPDASGSFTISAAVQRESSPLLHCYTVVYRYQGDEILDYIYAIPALEPLSRTSSGIINSTAGTKAQSYLTVFNLGDKAADIGVELADNREKQQRRKSLPLSIPAGGSKSVPLSLKKGVYRIDGGSTPYAAFLERYLSGKDGKLFAYLSSPEEAAAESLVPTGSALPAVSFAEMGNPGAESLQAKLKVFGASGELLTEKGYSLPPMGQVSLKLKKLLRASKLGYFTVEADGPVLAQSVVYGAKGKNFRWAYASPNLSGRKELIAGFGVNTVESAAHHLRAHSEGGLVVVRAIGHDVSAKLSPGLSDIELGLPADRAGAAIVNTSAAAVLQAVRTISTANGDYSFTVPVAGIPSADIPGIDPLPKGDGSKSSDGGNSSSEGDSQPSVRGGVQNEPAAPASSSSSSVPPSSSSASASTPDTAMPPEYQFYSSPDVICKHAQEQAERSGEPYSSMTFTPYLDTSREPIGDGQCRSTYFYCMGDEDPANRLETNWEGVIKTGQTFEPSEVHTGDEHYCSQFGRETKVACGQTWRMDEDPVDIGKYCNNTGNADKKERDMRCEEVNHRPGKSFWRDTFKALAAGSVAEITEDDFSGFMKNDDFDPSGNANHLKKFMAAEQPNYDTPYVGLTPELLQQLKSVVFDQGHVLEATLTLGNRVTGHAVILYDLNTETADDGTPQYVFKMLDPNPTGASELRCTTSGDPASGTRLWCTGGYGRSMLWLWGFNYPLTGVSLYNPLFGKPYFKLEGGLFAVKKEYCSQPGRKGKLCGSVPKSRVQEIAGALGALRNNFGTPGSSGGNCAGWSAAIIKLAYLANFVDEIKQLIPGNACASEVTGEERTAWCLENKSVCHVCPVVQFPLPVEGGGVEYKEAIDELGFSFCAYKTRPSGIPEDSFFFSSQYGLKGITSCSDQPPMSILSDEKLPIKVQVKASVTPCGQSSAAALVPATSLAAAKTDITSITPTPPSCSFQIPFSGSSLSFYYQSGFLFSHPAAPAAAADYETLDQSDLPPGAKLLSRIWRSDAVFNLESGVGWYWEAGSANPTFTLIDDISAVYINQLKTRLDEIGVTTSCRQEGVLPARFEQFLSAGQIQKGVDWPTTVIVEGIGTVLFGGQTVSAGKPVTLPVAIDKPITLTAKFPSEKRYPADLITPTLPRISRYRGVEWQGTTCGDYQIRCLVIGYEVVCPADIVTCTSPAISNGTIKAIFRELSQETAISPSIKTVDLELRPLFSNRAGNVADPVKGITFSSGLRNLGTQPASGTLTWFIDGVPYRNGSLNVPKGVTWLTGASTGTLTDLHIPASKFPTLLVGTHTLTLKADPEGKLAEIREDNNETSISFTVPGNPPSLSLTPLPASGKPGDILTLKWTSQNLADIVIIWVSGTQSGWISVPTLTTIAGHQVPASLGTLKWDTSKLPPGDYQVEVWQFGPFVPGTGAARRLATSTIKLEDLTPVISSFSAVGQQDPYGYRLVSFYWTVTNSKSCSLNGGSIFDPTLKTWQSMRVAGPGSATLRCTNGDLVAVKSAACP